MELKIEAVGDDEQIPVTHRQNGAQVSALVSELIAFGQSAALGERFKVNVDDVGQFVVALRMAASSLNSGVRIRRIVEDDEKAKTNRKGEEVPDLNQPGTVYFWFDKKREGVGRKAKATADTTNRTPVKAGRK